MKSSDGGRSVPPSARHDASPLTSSQSKKLVRKASSGKGSGMDSTNRDNGARKNATPPSFLPNDAYYSMHTQQTPNSYQHPTLMRMPSFAYPSPSTPVFPVVGTPQLLQPAIDAPVDDSGSLLQSLEKKDQMISQLGTVLAQMQQDTQGTAHVWKEKLQEVANLKQQLNLLAQELEATNVQKQELTTQLNEFNQVMNAQKEESEKTKEKHLEELKILNEEIGKQQNEASQLESKYRKELETMADELNSTKQSAASSMESLMAYKEEISTLHQKLDECNREKNDAAVAAKEMAQAFEVHKQGMEREKHELGQHLWNATKELESSKGREQEMTQKYEEFVKEYEKARVVWSQDFEAIKAERIELMNVQQNLERTIEGLKEQVDIEKKQKEELNGYIGSELQKLEVAKKGEESSKAQVAALSDEAQHWKETAMSTEKRLEESHQQMGKLEKELSEVRDRLEQAEKERLDLEQNNSERSSIVQELNDKLRETMAENEEASSNLEKLSSRWEQHEQAIDTCLELLFSSSDKNELVNMRAEAFPTAIIDAVATSVDIERAMEQLKMDLLEVKQLRDSEKDKYQATERTLVDRINTLNEELSSTKEDAVTLTKELKELHNASGGQEAALSSQVEKLSNEIQQAHADYSQKLTQLQKALESQRNRNTKLEEDKKELLKEAEDLNTSIEKLYAADKQKQLELDQVRDVWKEIQVQHNDLKEQYEDLQTTSSSSIDALNQRLSELQESKQALEHFRSDAETEMKKLAQALDVAQGEIQDLSSEHTKASEQWKSKEEEYVETITEKKDRLEEMMGMLTQLRSRGEYLEKSREEDTKSAQQSMERMQQQLRELEDEKAKLEHAYLSLKKEHESMSREIFAEKENVTQLQQSRAELEEANETLTQDTQRLQSDLERTLRTKSTIQLELNRCQDDYADIQRQLEVARRDARLIESQKEDELEKARSEMEEAQAEVTDLTSQVESLQTKMASIQSAANATINDLMTELQNAQDTLTYEKSRSQKDAEQWRAQVSQLQEQLFVKEREGKEMELAMKQTQQQTGDTAEQLNLQLSRTKATLDTKKQEVERLTQELEHKTTKLSEYERKFAPLQATKDQLQAKQIELKQNLESKVKELRDLDEKWSKEVSRMTKEKRDVDMRYAALKEEIEMNGDRTGHLNNEIKSLKSVLERTKGELSKANAELRASRQQTESVQAAANETINELNIKLKKSESQLETAVAQLENKLKLEQDRRREAEVQKLELQTKVAPAEPSTICHSIPVRSASTSQLEQVGLNLPQGDISSPVEKESEESSVSLDKNTHDHFSDGQEMRNPDEFGNEKVWSKSDLANMPIAMIKAQIGLEMSSTRKKSSSRNAKHPNPGKNSPMRKRSSRSNSITENEQETSLDTVNGIPRLPLADVTSDTSGLAMKSGRSASHQGLSTTPFLSGASSKYRSSLNMNNSVEKKQYKKASQSPQTKTKKSGNNAVLPRIMQ